MQSKLKDHIGFGLSGQDETALLQELAALRASEARMALAIEGSGTGVWDRNIVSGEMYYSPGWKAMLGYEEHEISNRIDDSYTRIHPDDLRYVQAAIQAHFTQQSESYQVEHRIRCKNGNWKWISSRGRVVSRDAAGRPLRMIGTSTDISAMRELSQRLQRSVDLITALTNEIPGLAYEYRMVADGSGFYSYASAGIRDIYELTPEQVATDGALVESRIHPEDLAGYRATFAASAVTLAPWQLEYRVVLPRQGLRWRHGIARPSRQADGSVVWHGLITDLTERKQNEIELEQFATIDFLTQLPNRRYFMSRLESELVRVQRSPGSETAVLMCDLDHFKRINDDCGHAAGDEVLKKFGAILRDALRKSDMVGRVGGEEFCVVLPATGLQEAVVFASRIQQQILKTPLMTGEAAIAVTVSFGIALMRATDASADAALSRSDIALYRAKSGGRDRIELITD